MKEYKLNNSKIKSYFPYNPLAKKNKMKIQAV